jgi:hypothetical protein
MCKETAGGAAGRPWSPQRRPVAYGELPPRMGHCTVMLLFSTLWLGLNVYCESTMFTTVSV